MIDISIVWQKIKLVFSFLKFPQWFYQKALFYCRYFKFKRLPEDKQDFLMKVYNKEHSYETRFFWNNQILIKCLEIDRFVNYEWNERIIEYKLEQYTEESFVSYNIVPQYLPIIQKLWRKKHDKIFKTQKFDYNTEDDIPF